MYKFQHPPEQRTFFFTEAEQQIHGNQYHTIFKKSFLYIPLVDILRQEGANAAATEFSSGGITDDNE